jgi:hypothetical protein
MSRSTYVYKVVVDSYPPGSDQPGWKPACWSDPQQLAVMPGRPGIRQLKTLALRIQLARREFRWPRPKLFLSPGGACHRAFLLHWYGAEVRVVRSDPVTWPDPEQETTA